MKNLVLMTLLGMFFSVGGLGQNSTIESVYTDLGIKACQKLEPAPNFANLYYGQCPGVGDYRLKLGESEYSQWLILVTPTGQGLMLDVYLGSSPSKLGSQLEWRVRRDGQKILPFALIVQVNVVEDTTHREKTSPYLVIVTIAGEAACVTDVIKPEVQNQKLKARQLADVSDRKACLIGGQSVDRKKLEIDNFVIRVDQNFEALKKDFTVREKHKNKKFLIEESNFNIRKDELLTRKFSYLMNEKGLERLMVHYQVETVSAEENYYFKDQKLVYATEEHFFKHEGEVNSVWTGVYYFSNGILFHLSTNGHGKSETDDWDPDLEVPRMSRTRIKQLSQYLAQKKEQEKK